MTKKLNLVTVIALTLSVLTISGCGKNNQIDMDDSLNTQTGEVMTGDNTVTVTVETGSTDTGTTATTTATTDAAIVSKEISYEVPSAQPTSITVTATLDADKNIKTISVAWKFSEEKSQWYIKAFSDNISAAVVGKKLSEANVDKLAGASLTSNAFNLAIADLQTK